MNKNIILGEFRALFQIDFDFQLFWEESTLLNDSWTNRPSLTSSLSTSWEMSRTMLLEDVLRQFFIVYLNQSWDDSCRKPMTILTVPRNIPQKNIEWNFWKNIQKSSQRYFGGVLEGAHGIFLHSTLAVLTRNVRWAAWYRVVLFSLFAFRQKFHLNLFYWYVTVKTLTHDDSLL